MSSDTLLALIDAIYSAAADPSQWPSVARQIQGAIGGHSVNLALEDLGDSRVNLMYTTGVAEEDIRHYEQDVMGKDRMTDLLNVVPECSAFTSQDFYDIKSVRSMYCYEAFYEKVGYTHFNVGLFYRNNGRRAWLSVARSEKDPLYTPEEQMLMQVLTPHLRRAFLINVQLLEAQLTSKIALDSLEHIAAATALLAKNGQVVQHNSRAEQFLHVAGGSAHQATLRLPDTHANNQLHTLIGAVGQDETREKNGIVPFADNGVKKTSLCFPWRSSDEQYDWLGKSACCIVFILSPTADAPRVEVLQQTFDLSCAEVKVLQRLMDSMQVKEIAGCLFISEATVRFHIRNLLRKTQSRSQAEMMAKVFNTVSVRVE
jgi:DNA-binding CsgD family transcriptional regulator